MPLREDQRDDAYKVQLNAARLAELLDGWPCKIEAIGENEALLVLPKELNLADDFTKLARKSNVNFTKLV